ncbi:MAG: hypothetical protein Q9222_001136 [Ikaeria aurantiellina]
MAQFNLEMRLDPKTRCEPSSAKVELYYGYCNILSDSALLVMPMPLLYQIKMVRSKKIGTAIIFATGFLVSGIAIYRQYVLHTNKQTSDVSWQAVPSIIWITTEVNLSIVCACLPVLAPLACKLSILVQYLPESVRYKFSGHSAGEKVSRSQVRSGRKMDMECALEVDREERGTPQP